MAGLDIKYRIRSVPYPLLDMMARGMEKLGRKQRSEPMFTHYSVAKLNFDVTLDTQRAETELGYSPVVSLDEGIQRTALWLQDHGRLQHQHGIISHPN